MELIKLLEADKDNHGDICHYEIDSDVFKLIEEDKWTQDYEYQHGGFVVQHIESGRHFYVSRSRSGSPFTDWHYSESTVSEVKQVTKTITVTQWEAI